MSTKPTTDAPWDTGLTNLIAPTSGHKSSGWSTNEKPASSEMNGWMNLVGLFTTYLRDSDLDLAGISFDLTQTVTLASATSNNLDVSGGAGSLAKICYVTLVDGAGGPYTITGITNTAPGRILIIQNRSSGNVTFSNNDSGSTSTSRFHDPSSASITIAPLGIIALLGTQTLDTIHGWFPVWATGKVQTIAEVMPVGTARPTGSDPHGVNVSTSVIIYAASASIVYYQMPFLRPGDIITGWRIGADRNVTGSAMTAELQYFDNSGTPHPITPTSSISVGTGQFLSNGTPYGGSAVAQTVATNQAYVIVVTPTGSTSPSADRTYVGEVTYQRAAL